MGLAQVDLTALSACNGSEIRESRRMNILLHDFAGHPFQAELSRELARRGHRVTHAWFAGDTGPKGRMAVVAGDPDGLGFLPLGAGLTYSKTNFRQRRAGDIAYGKELGAWVAQNRPDIVISGNTPTEAQEGLVAACAASNVPFIYWCQDFYSIAASRLLARKLPGIGHGIGAYYRFLERRQMRRAARVLHITEAFRPQTDRWGIPSDRVAVIPNWGAIDEIDVMARDTGWAHEQGLSDGTRFLYSGTLAMKHNPALLAGLAGDLSSDEELVLVSAGVGADHLQERAASLPRLRPLPLQPFDRFAEVLASGDVLLAVIEREAGTFSVPSKILSYLCAGRPIVLAAPRDNLAAQILRDTGAGTVVEPEDIAGFTKAALAYRDNPDAAARAGQAGRAYAEENFILSNVADRFETLFTEALSCQ
ncbi:MAG: glycosyltransferase family 4 protein [Pelagimonas sp.]|jgi:glycosyltransferase involved in cell wall biosynthesis|nr:glycosyltransferase family 4 protein [Pelagimonas sp.]